MAVVPAGRRDAQRNRARLLEAAHAAFTTTGADVALEAVAAAAGVGIGTLYRHFPSRAALVEALYRDELAALCARAPALLAHHPPVDALRVWMGAYADFVATKRGMAEALREVIASGAITSIDTRRRLAEPVTTLLGAGVQRGQLRADARPEDVVASLAGVLLAATSREQVDRLLDLLVDGLRPR